jgi:ribosomal-protein-alanine N-acetyltransferase
MSAAAAVIRPGRPGDAAAILALEALFPGDRMSPASVRRFLRVPTAAVLIAEREGAVLGNLVWLRRRGSRRARIYSVVVAAEARGLGLGRQLVERMQRDALAAGCVTATLEVRADNTAARALYAGLGYAVEAALPGYYEDGGDGLRLTRALR